MADEKELDLKGIDTANPEGTPDGNGEPDSNPIIESSKDDIKSSDSFVLPKSKRDETLSGLNAAALSSQKSPTIRGTDFTFSKEVSEAIDQAYVPFDLAKAIPDPNERAEYIRQHGSKMVKLLNEDVQGITFADELKDLYNFRQQNYNVQLKKFVDKLDNDQGFFDAAGNTFQKFLGKTGVAVSSLIPLVYGLAKGLVTWNAENIFNNTLFDQWDKMDKWTDEHYVVYGGYDYTQPGEDGKQKDFFARMADNPMKSINNDVIPAASFIAGAILTETVAGLLAAPTGGASLAANTARLAAYGTRTFSKGLRVARGLDTVADMYNMQKIASLTAKFQKGIGTATTMVRTAGYESSLIARDTYQSTKDKSIRNYINSDVGVKRGLKQKYENIIRDNMDEFGNLSITETEILTELEKDIPKKDRIKIQNNAENAGELAWFSNVPLVGFSNMMQFPRIFNSSYRLGQGLLKKAGQKINPLTGTKMVGGKMVARGAERGFAAKTFGRVILPTAARGLGESFEEFSQGVFEEGYSNYYSAQFTDPSRETLNEFLPTMAQSAKEYFKSVEGQDSIAIGGLMGMLGIPGVRVRSAQERAAGKWRMGFTWYGGFYEGWQDVGSKMEQAQNQADIYNTVSTNVALQKSLDNMLKGVGIQAEMDKALEKGDIFNYKNKEHEAFYNFVATRLETGIADTIFQDLDALDEMSLEEFNKTYAHKDQEFQYNAAQKKKIIETARNNTKSIIKATEKTDELLNYERRFVDKVFNKNFLGSVSYDTPLRRAVNADKGLLSGKGNIDSKLESFVQKEFEDASEQEQYILKERLKMQLRNQLAFLTSSAENIEKREKELTDQLRGLVGDSGLSAFLSDKNFIRFVIGQETTTITLEDGTEVKSTDPKFANTKDKVNFAVSQILADIKAKNPDQYNFARRQIKEVVTDLFKLKDKKAKAAAFYNMLMTEKGAQEFTAYLESQKEIMAQEAVEAAIALQEEQMNSAKSSTTTSNVNNTANDLNNQNRSAASQELRNKISEKQTKELDSVIKALDELTTSKEGTISYSDLDSEAVMKILEKFPNAFQLIKDRLKGAIPGLQDIDSVPSLKHLESENFFDGASIEQILAETLFDIISDYQSKIPGPDPNLNNAAPEQININNAFAPNQASEVNQTDLLNIFDDVEGEGVATDSFMISITNDKEFQGKGPAVRNSDGKFKDMETDQPLDKSAVNDPNTLTLEQIREQKPVVKLRYSQNEFGTAEYPSGYRSIDIVYVDSKTGAETFYGRIPAYQEIITDPKTGEQSYAFKKGISQKLINLRESIAKAEVNPDTGFLEIATTETDFKGYEATIAPKTETTTETKPAAQIALEEKVEELEAKDKTFRDEDGSVSDKNLEAWKQNRKDIDIAKENARRGNLPEGYGIAIKTRVPGDNANKVLQGEEAKIEEEKIEALIQNVLNGKMTAEEVVIFISGNYAFLANEMQSIRDYIRDRTTDAPEVGNNKAPFAVWRRGETETIVNGEPLQFKEYEDGEFSLGNNTGFAEIYNMKIKTEEGQPVYSLQINILKKDNRGQGFGKQIYIAAIKKLIKQGATLMPDGVVEGNEIWESFEKDGLLKTVTAGKELITIIDTDKFNNKFNKTETTSPKTEVVAEIEKRREKSFKIAKEPFLVRVEEIEGGFVVVDPMNPPREGESYNPMPKEEATRQVEELNKDRKQTDPKEALKSPGFWIYINSKGREIEKLAGSNTTVEEEINAAYDSELAALEKQTTSPETEVEQSARRIAINNYFENILGQIEITALEPNLKEMDGEIERTIGEKKCN
jgi:hypothetical protein